MAEAGKRCSVGSETKLVPAFKVGKRNRANTTAFVQDVAGRLRAAIAQEYRNLATEES